jgi:hypothetical protein
LFEGGARLDVAHALNRRRASECSQRVLPLAVSISPLVRAGVTRSSPSPSLAPFVVASPLPLCFGFGRRAKDPVETRNGRTKPGTAPALRELLFEAGHFVARLDELASWAHSPEREADDDPDGQGSDDGDGEAAHPEGVDVERVAANTLREGSAAAERRRSR